MKFWNLSERRRTVLKFEPKLDLKFMRVKIHGSKTKIMDETKNRRGLTQVKTIKFFFA